MTTWEEWTEWFTLAFGLTDKQAATVAVWVADVFMPSGADVRELHAAALDVLKGGPPRFLNELLPVLLDAVRAIRTQEVMAREENLRQNTPVVGALPCAACRGVGMATVPQRPQPPDAVRLKYLATWLLPCKCMAGVRVATRGFVNHRKEASLTLEQYERDNPDWQEEFDWWRKHEAAQGYVAGATSEWASLVERMTKAAKQRRGGASELPF